MAGDEALARLCILIMESACLLIGNRKTHIHAPFANVVVVLNQYSQSKTQSMDLHGVTIDQSLGIGCLSLEGKSHHSKN